MAATIDHARRARQRTSPLPSPETNLEAAVTKFHLDLPTFDLPALLREELALRRRFSGTQHPGRYVVERLAALEVHIAKGGAL